MELSDYLAQINASTDEELTTKLHIEDNWPILLATDKDTLVNFLTTHGCDLEDIPSSQEAIDYLKERGLGDNKTEERISYDEARRLIRIDQKLHRGHTSSYGSIINDDEVLRHEKLQLATFRISMIIHGNINYKPLPKIVRDTANLTMQVGQWAIRERIALCLPTSYDHLKKDYERIVYFLPNKS